MIEIFSYIILIVVFAIIFFFLFRTLIIAISMFRNVPYLPSSNIYKEAVKYLDIKKGDTVLDIGSGDGRVLLYLSKKYPGSNFVGIEKDFFLVLYSNIAKVLLGRKNLSFECKDATEFNISDFDAIYLYLLPDFVDEILQNKQTKKGCRIVSFHFPLGEKFSNSKKIMQYPVKYKGTQEQIFKWVNNGNSKR